MMAWKHPADLLEHLDLHSDARSTGISADSQLPTDHKHTRSTLERYSLDTQGPRTASARSELRCSSAGALKARDGAIVSKTGPVRTGLAAECGLCLEEFQDSGERIPRNLHCGHTFCTECISKLIFYKVHARAEVDCPKCHKVTPVPDKDVKTLPKNFGLIEVISSSQSTHHHTALASTQVTDNSAADLSHPVCVVHKDRISSYCLEDDKLVCSSCQLYGPHKGHNCLLVTEAAKQFREKLSELNPEVQKQREQIQSLLHHVEDNLKKVEENGGLVLDAVDSQFALLTAALEKRRKELRVGVLERTQVRVHALMTQAVDLRDNMEAAASVYSQAAGLILGDDFTLLQGCSLALDKVEAVFTNPPSSEPSAGPDLSIDFSKEVFSDITSHLDEFGMIKSVAGIVKNVRVDEYHDGFRIFWDRHNLADNEGISYHLQVLVGEGQEDGNDYVMLYRGGNTKYTWKTELKQFVPYNFRVQVRTTDGVGHWSSPIRAYRAEPGFQWHDSRRSVRIELTSDKLEATLSRGSSGSHWATFAGNKLFESGQLYVELNILDVGRGRPGKERLAFGVIQCTSHSLSSISWAECIGKTQSSQSFAYYPVAGTKHCRLFPDGKFYANPISLEAGDRLGMLLDIDRGRLNFFHNGMDLGIAFDNIRSEKLLPAVSLREKVRIRLCFPPPPFSQRDPRIVQLSSFGAASQYYRKRT